MSNTDLDIVSKHERWEPKRSECARAAGAHRAVQLHTRPLGWEDQTSESSGRWEPAASAQD